MERDAGRLTPEGLLAELGWLRALAHRLVADPNVADDVLQRVCLHALERPPRTRAGAAGVRRWLSTLTRRFAAHDARSRGRRAHRERRVAVRESTPESAADAAVRREVLHHVVDAFAELDAPDRELLARRYFDGLDVAAIAAGLGIGDAATRQRLARARRRLRDRLAARAGDDGSTSIWLAALAPLAAPAGLAPRATPPGSAVSPAPAAPPPGLATSTVAPSSAAAAAPPSLGAVVMAKLTAIGGVQLAVTLGVVAVLSLTAWQVLDVGSAADLPGGAAPAVIPAPPASKGPAPPTVAARVEAAQPTPTPSAEPPAPAASPAEGSAAPAPSDLARRLDEATASFTTSDPDLQALDEVLRRLAAAAVLVPDSVARDPADGSVSGALRIEGTELLARWSVDAEGGYAVHLDGVPGEFEPPFLVRGLRLRFRDDGGRAGDVETSVQFHPSSRDIPAIQALIGDEERPVGWSLSIGPDGTRGTPITMQVADDALIIVGQGGGPGVDAGWAYDTSGYDRWLGLLRGVEP